MKAIRVFGAVCTIVAGVILRGWILSILWSWFIVSQFKVPEIEIVPAIGLSLVSSYLIGSSSTSTDFKDIKVYIKIIALPFTVLGMGWVVKLFM